ncbi:leucine-richprotein [Angomonas deanei]|uniref:Leucine Rich repeat, putative n=1 Tax=Angomonas deanei TaxID=59799 RepID=A0A7G2CEI3_9TRYP|nr:leucine-richprotein [Angomonas deanei]CAD2218298.1 Leucine Rich repeat, putative [Angomonas deanei]|eukprot:EPY39314.1 leucine-richprotein [Angomonas deanei]
MYSLALLLQSMPIVTLNVVTNHITPRGLPTLCDGINSSQTITELSLAFNLLGDEGAAIVAETLSAHPTLRTLDISDNRISDAGAIAIAANFILSKECKIVSLNLSVNQIGDVGFQAIAEALTKYGNRHLAHLDLGCNDAVGDEGRTALVKSLLYAKYIRMIDFTSCNLSDDDVRHIISAIESKRSSLVSIEWFNNPRISLDLETQLFHVISQVEEVEAPAKTGVPSNVIAAVGLSATLVALVLYKVRRSA